MLRALFGEAPRKWAGKELKAVEKMTKFSQKCDQWARKYATSAIKYGTYAIRTEGLLHSFDELEQSCYAAHRYAAEVHSSDFTKMNDLERLNYNRHVYFDKNAYIRFFALLDKLGTLLNEFFQLHMENKNMHYSFFMVLHDLHFAMAEKELAQKLTKMKVNHHQAIDRLHRRRNLEIHQVNAELKDDLLQTLRMQRSCRTLEDLSANLHDLKECWKMGTESLFLTFDHLLKYFHP